MRQSPGLDQRLLLILGIFQMTAVVTGHQMTVAQIHNRGIFLTLFRGIGAAGMEVAAHRGIHRTGDISLQQHLFLVEVIINRGSCRQQCLGIVVLGIVE